MVPATDLLHRVPTAASLAMLAIAALHDICFRTLPDTLAIGLVGCGIAAHLAVGDLGTATVVAVAVFIASMLAWRFGALGGGDVKLLGATALAVPLNGVPTLVLGTAMAGGLIALGFLALRPLVPGTAGPRPAALLARILRTEAWRIRRRGPLPYAVAIAAGGAASLLGG